MDVRLFGAKCDGVTDDTDAIQAAIDSTGRADLPGICRITQPIYLDSADRGIVAGAGGALVCDPAGQFDFTIQIRADEPITVPRTPE